MPDLNVQKISKTAPACESGRHIVHPFMECDEVDMLSAAFAELYEQAMTAAFAEADQLLTTGNGTGEALGFLAAAGDRREATPVERAFAILEPHLRDVPLFRPRGRLLP